MNVTDNLRYVELYCENQGDKFRGMSEDVLAVLNGDASETEKVAEVRTVVAGYAPKYQYHVNRIVETLDHDDED